MALVYTKTSSGKKKLNKRDSRALEEHKAYLRSLGYTGKPVNRKDTWDQPKSYVRRPRLPPVSNNLGTGGGFKRSIDDHQWKRDRQESAETIKAIEAKKKQIAPAYSKGAFQYLTPQTNPHEIGKKL